MTVKEYCNSCQNKGSHKCHSCYGKYYDGVLQGKPTKYRKKQQTNADRIRAMSDEELYELFREIYDAGCNDATSYEWGILRNSFEWTEEWLKQPVEE